MNRQTKKKTPHFSSILLIRFSDTLQKHYCCKLISVIWDSWKQMFVVKTEAKQTFSTSSFHTGFHASSAKGPYFPLFLLLLIQSWNSVDLRDSHQIQFWDDFVFPYLHIQIESQCSSWVTCCSLHLFPFIWILPRAHCSLIQTSGCFWFTVHCKSLFLSIEDVILENQPSLLDPFFFQQDLLWDSSKHILE